MAGLNGTSSQGLLGAEEVSVFLGDKEYRCVPQRKAYLQKKLSKVFSMEGLNLDEDASFESFMKLVDEHAYKVLRVFIPDLMPEYEFAGYASAQAMEQDDYDEDRDKSPTVPQVRNAVGVLVELNGLDLAKYLKNFVSPDFLRAFMTSQIANLMTGDSATSSAPSTDTPSTKTGTTEPTAPVSPSDSPTPDSPNSPELTVVGAAESASR
jgi:hypothetical protein